MEGRGVNKGKGRGDKKWGFGEERGAGAGMRAMVGGGEESYLDSSFVSSSGL